MKKNAGGRPKLPKNKGKAAVVAVRMLKIERRQVEDAAKRAGVGLSEWVRNSLLAAVAAGKIDSANTEDAGIEPHAGKERDLGM